jgi:hypothetical protein
MGLFMPCFPFQQHRRRDVQAHQRTDSWDSYEVSIKVTVKAKDHKAAKDCYLSIVCGNQKEGRLWRLIKKGFTKVEIIPPQTDPEIRVTKREVI